MGLEDKQELAKGAGCMLKHSFASFQMWCATGTGVQLGLLKSGMCPNQRRVKWLFRYNFGEWRMRERAQRWPWPSSTAALVGPTFVLGRWKKSTVCVSGGGGEEEEGA